MMHIISMEVPKETFKHFAYKEELSGRSIAHLATSTEFRPKQTKAVCVN